MRINFNGPLLLSCYVLCWLGMSIWLIMCVAMRCLMQAPWVFFCFCVSGFRYVLFLLHSSSLLCVSVFADVVLDTLRIIHPFLRDTSHILALLKGMILQYWSRGFMRGSESDYPGNCPVVHSEWSSEDQCSIDSVFVEFPFTNPAMITHMEGMLCCGVNSCQIQSLDQSELTI